MSSCQHLRFILKTPKGYLTPTGTNADICNKDIIVLNVLSLGGYYKSKKQIVDEFFKLSTENYFKIEECEVLSYCCNKSWNYYCIGCIRRNICDLWNNRKNIKFHKVH